MAKTKSQFLDKNGISISKIKFKNQLQLKIKQNREDIGTLEITTGKQCYINSMRLKTEKRGYGIGSYIYPIIENKYLKSCQGIRLDAESQDAMHFWKKHGFSIDYYDDENESYAMSKGNT